MGAAANPSRRSLLSGFCLAPALRLLRAQTQSPTFSADVKVVNLFATVRDKQGQVMLGLKKDDFLLQEDRRPQIIRYFSKESDLPLHLGLLVDVSGSQRRLIPDERTASLAFFDQVLREIDRAFVIHFQGQVELLQNFTVSRAALESALNRLEWPSQYSGRGGRYPGPGGPGVMRGRPGGGTALYDAALLASDELMSKQTGRKALIILTDGVDTASLVRIEECVESAQRADTLVYSVLFEDPDAYGGGLGFRDGRGALQYISQLTGGHMLTVSKKRSLADVYATVEEELRSMYSIGYTPDPARGSSAYHRIRLTTREKGYLVQTRDGYYEN